MASTGPNTSRRSMLAFLAALPGVALPTTPAIAALPSLSSPIDGGTWRGCVAEYRAAQQAVKDAMAACKTAEAACREAYGKIVLPPAFRSPWTRAMGWWDMTPEEVRADMIVRRGGGNSRQLNAIVDKEMRGVARFKQERERAMAPKTAAAKKLDLAEDRLSDAEDKLRDFQVGTIAEAVEKMAIARERDSDWIMEGVEADLKRLAA